VRTDRRCNAQLTVVGTDHRNRHPWRCAIFGDGILTPAISVLSAGEGVTVAAAQLEHVAVQSKGTERVEGISGGDWR
jgi:hypothetical protein